MRTLIAAVLAAMVLAPPRTRGCLARAASSAKKFTSAASSLRTNSRLLTRASV
jgi:hypothetical protein